MRRFTAPRAGPVAGLVAVLVVVLVVVGLGGCSEDNGPSAAVRRYCELVVQFPSPPPSEEPEQFQENMVRYVEQNHDYFEDLIDAAPDEIKQDVENAVVTLRRVAAGELEAFDTLDLREADEFQDENCS
ncbi:MAG: hypothetical protein ACRD0O_07275 [Acidimicrobiia bacterium]